MTLPQKMPFSNVGTSETSVDIYNITTLSKASLRKTVPGTILPSSKVVHTSEENCNIFNTIRMLGMPHILLLCSCAAVIQLRGI